MTPTLLWVIIVAAPTIAATAAVYITHTTERAHWLRLAQSWHDTGYSKGWTAHQKLYGTMMPEMVFTQEGTLEPAPGKWAPWPPVDQAFDAAIGTVRRQFDEARAGIYLP